MSRQEKAKLRHRCHSLREEMSLEQVRAGSRAVCEYLSNWPPFQRATSVLSFLAFRKEIDLSPLFERWSEKRWLVPRVVEGKELASGQKSYLVLHPYAPGRLIRHRFGMLEPDPSLPTVDASEVELVLVPGVAFDQRGGRLGYGGGFYDRLLPLARRSIRVGVTYNELILDAIPMEPWDYHVEWLVTPAGLYRTRQS